MNPVVKVLLIAGIVASAVLIIYIVLKQRTGASPSNTMSTKGDRQFHEQHSRGEKEHVNVAVLGVPDLLGVELSSAMLRIASETGSADLTLLERLKKHEPEGASIAPFTYLEYETRTKHIAHMLLRNSHATPMQLILGLRMADAVVLFVGAEGFTPESKKHIMLAEAAGVQRVIIFAEGGNNSSPIEKRDLESVLVGTGFKPQDIPIVVGKVSSDVNGAVADLLEKLEPLVNRRLTASDRSFLLPIDDVFSIQGRGIVVTGMVERGLLRVGETVELLGVGQRLSVTCRGIEIFRGTLTVAHPGDCVGILLQGVERSQVSAGMVLASPRSVDLASRFRGRLCLLSNGNAGLRVPSTEKQDVELLIRTASVKAKATVLPVRANEANGQVSVEFTLAQSTPLEEGMWFAMVVDEQLAATGSVEEILGVRGEGVK